MINVPSTHDCPGGCGTPVEHELFACKECWHRLPSRYCYDIRSTYNVDHHEHAQAMVRAMTWFRAHPPRKTTTTTGVTP